MAVALGTVKPLYHPCARIISMISTNKIHVNALTLYSPNASRMLPLFASRRDLRYCNTRYRVTASFSSALADTDLDSSLDVVIWISAIDTRCAFILRNLHQAVCATVIAHCFSKVIISKVTHSCVTFHSLPALHEDSCIAIDATRIGGRPFCAAYLSKSET